MTMRNLIDVRTAHPSRDGDGVAIQRISGMRHAGMDPILLLDELSSEYREDFAGGFPPHPHRGMQTLTYMKAGGIAHQDSEGNQGEIRGGGAQWMSAGRGVIHSEMPTQDTDGIRGFQLWFNLPASEKMSAPAYRDFAADELSHGELTDIRWTAIAGNWRIEGQDVAGPLQSLSAEGSVLDLNLNGDANVLLEDLGDANVLVYVYGGAITSPRPLQVHQMGVTGEGGVLSLQAGPEGADVLVLKGRPIREPVANYGPFVMNTQEEIEQAIQDYQAGRLAS